MRYDAAHKARSRLKILEAARALFRRDGFEGASIDQVMNRAGLTRGAFYAHFGSKRELVHEVMEIEAGLVSALHRAAEAPEPPQAALAALAHYLDPAERQDVAHGCPLVAHPVDAIRGDADLRRDYQGQLSALVTAIEACVAEGSGDEALVAALLAVGTGLLSAAVEDPEVADRISRVGLQRIGELLEDLGPKR